jgi:predicted small secreted protein
MKTTLLLLVGALLVLTSCRNGRGGPVERAGRSVDNAVDWAGYGVRRAGEGIQRAAR